MREREIISLYRKKIANNPRMMNMLISIFTGTRNLFMDLKSDT